jgi:hypothetical protein
MWAANSEMKKLDRTVRDVGGGGVKVRVAAEMLRAALDVYEAFAAAAGAGSGDEWARTEAAQVHHQVCVSLGVSHCASQCVSLTVCLPHCVSHCASLTVCLSLCLPHGCVSHCVSLTVSLTASLTVRLSRSLSHCVRLSLCLSHCVSLTVSLTVSLSRCLSYCVSLIRWDACTPPGSGATRATAAVAPKAEVEPPPQPN